MILRYAKISSIMILLCTSAWANDIFISQSGDDFKLEVQQRSENNSVYATVSGDNNDVTVRQGMHADGTLDGDETGGHEAILSISGQNNTVASYQTDENRGGGGGSDHYLNNSIIGDGNIISHTQRGKTGHDGKITIAGDDNTVTVLQRGNGGKNWSDIDLTGDGHTVTHTQKGGGGATGSMDLTNSGGSYTVDVMQNSSSWQSYSLTGSCANTSGCSVTVTQN